MEELLKQIINRLDSFDRRFDTIDLKLTNLENGQKDLQSEQSEMRKEVGFYYGSMMKKLPSFVKARHFSGNNDGFVE